MRASCLRTAPTSPRSGLRTFDEEEADSYEIGFKSRLFDRRVQFNGALSSTGRISS